MPIYGDNSPGVTTNPDGTINYGSLPGASSGAGKPIPVNPNTGALDIWSYVLPPALLGTDPATGKPVGIYLGDGYGTHQVTEMRGSGQDRKKVVINEPNSFPDEMSASEVMDHFQKVAYSDPNQWMSIQKMLIDADFYGQGGTTSGLPKFGGFDQNAQQALAQGMVYYLQATQGGAFKGSFIDFLQQRAQQVTAQNGGQPISGDITGTGPGSGRAPLTINYSDPAYLEQRAQSAARASLGRVLSKDELSKFVDSFHSAEAGAQTANYNGQDSTSPDAGADSLNFLVENHAPEIQQHEAKGYMNALMNLFLPGQDQRANINVNPLAQS